MMPPPQDAEENQLSAHVRTSVYTDHRSDDDEPPVCFQVGDLVAFYRRSPDNRRVWAKKPGRIEMIKPWKKHAVVRFINNEKASLPYCRLRHWEPHMEHLIDDFGNLNYPESEEAAMVDQFEQERVILMERREGMPD